MTKEVRPNLEAVREEEKERFKDYVEHRGDLQQQY